MGVGQQGRDRQPPGAGDGSPPNRRPYGLQRPKRSGIGTSFPSPRERRHGEWLVSADMPPIGVKCHGGKDQCGCGRRHHDQSAGRDRVRPVRGVGDPLWRQPRLPRRSRTPSRTTATTSARPTATRRSTPTSRRPSSRASAGPLPEQHTRHDLPKVTGNKSDRIDEFTTKTEPIPGFDGLAAQCDPRPAGSGRFASAERRRRRGRPSAQENLRAEADRVQRSSVSSRRPSRLSGPASTVRVGQQRVPRLPVDRAALRRADQRSAQPARADTERHEHPHPHARAGEAAP